MLRRLLIILALVVMLGTAVPRAEAATTATATFTGTLEVWSNFWYLNYALCAGSSFDIQNGTDAPFCSFSVYGTASGSCNVLGGAVSGQVTFSWSGTTLNFTGTALVTGVTSPVIAITGFATNPWTGKVAFFTAAINTMNELGASGCSRRPAHGAFNVTPVI